MNFCQSMSPPIHPQPKSWVLALWWVLWAQKLSPFPRSYMLVLWFVNQWTRLKKIIKKNPLTFIRIWAWGTLGSRLRCIQTPHLESWIEKDSFGYAIWFDGSWVDVGFIDSPKVNSPKEVEARATLYALKESSLKGFHKIYLFSDACGVTRATIGSMDWSIHPILLDFKKIWAPSLKRSPLPIFLEI